jgi:hypothetical protein
VRVEDLADVFDFVAENAAFRFAAGAKVEDLSIGIVVVVGLRERDGRRRPRLGGGWPVSWRRWDVELGDEGGDEDVLEDEWLLGLLEADGCFGKVERSPKVVSQIKSASRTTTRSLRSMTFSTTRTRTCATWSYSSGSWAASSKASSRRCI